MWLLIIIHRREHVHVVTTTLSFMEHVHVVTTLSFMGGKQQLFLSQGHVWCSYHKVISGVLITRSCLVFLSQGHVWCSYHKVISGVPEDTCSESDTSLRALLSLALPLMDWGLSLMMNNGTMEPAFYPIICVAMGSCDSLYFA